MTVSNYLPPSVIVNGQASAQGSTATVSPATCALLVNVSSLPSTTVTIPLSQTKPNSQGINANYVISPNFIPDTLVITNLGTNTPLQAGTDYALISNSISWTGNSANLASGGPIQITYQYVDNVYFSPLAYTTSSAVEQYYGTAFTSNGAVNNLISAAAVNCFNGGTTTLIIQPFFTGTLPSTLPSGVASIPNLTQAMQNLMVRDDVNIIVPVGCGQTQLTTIAGIVTAPTADEEPKQAMFAIDSGSPTISELSTFAQSLNSSQIMLIGNVTATSTAGASLPPSMYACTLAGLNETLPFYQTMTHQTVPGFALDRQYTVAQMNTLASNAITIISALGGVNKVRQSLCTLQAQEVIDWDYGTVLNYLYIQCKSLLDQYIGKPQTTGILNAADGTMQGFLNTLVSNNVLSDYKNLTVTYSTTQMGTMLVSFDAAWLSPINYIRVNFNFDAFNGATQNFSSQTLGSGTVVNGQVQTSPSVSSTPSDSSSGSAGTPSSTSTVAITPIVNSPVHNVLGKGSDHREYPDIKNEHASEVAEHIDRPNYLNEK